VLNSFEVRRLEPCGYLARGLTPTCVGGNPG